MDRRSFLASASLVAASAAGAPLLAGCTTESGDNNPTAAVPDAALADLQSRLSGSLLRPDQPDFAAQNLPANDVYASVTPLAIAMCADPADVATCVTWCRDEGVQPVVRGGGHNYIGASTTTGLLIKTTEMNQVDIDRQSGRMTIGAGTLNQNVLDTLRNGRWMLPIGTCPSVGVTGLVLGGGFGDNSRWGGLTCDHLLETDLVLASGETVTAGSKDNADLYWGLRGAGGGNFGVNTSLTFQLIEVPRPTITVFGLRFTDREDIVAAWSAFDTLMLTAPDELSGFTGIRNVRPLGANAPASRGHRPPFPSLTIDGCFQGSADQARQVLQPVFQAATPQDQVFGEFDWWSAQLEWLAVPEMPQHGLAEAARFTDRATPPDVLDELLSRVLAAPGGTEEANAEVRMMCWSGGAVNRRPSDATAFPHRSSHNLLRPAIWWREQPESMIKDLQDWQRDTFAYVSDHAQQGSFVNWPYAQLPDWEAAYYGDNAARLREVKQRYDPDNLFRYDQSIPLP